MCDLLVLPLGMPKLLLIALLVSAWSYVFSQDGKFQQTLTAGIEFRPIFPADFLKTGNQEAINDDYSILVSSKFSFSAGMVIRYGFHKRFALETGLSFVQRNYNLTVHRDETVVSPIVSTPEYTSNTDFTIIGYEHPIKLLVFVRLAEKLYMNAAAGFNITFFPSDIFTTDEGQNATDQYFKHSSLRLGFDGEPGADGFITGGAIANLGMEYRTKKAGYFYLGATYQVPFAPIYRSKFQYGEVSYVSEVQGIQLNGSYLTFDVRYFFHSKPIVRKAKKKKKKLKSKKGSAEPE
ncbi:MAG: hypothetical protein ACI8VL_000763 [Bacteroidia bacterium]